MCRAIQAGGLIIARFWCYLDPLIQKTKQKKRQSWTPSEKLSGSVHAEDRFSNEMVHFPLLELRRELNTCSDSSKHDSETFDLVIH